MQTSVLLSIKPRFAEAILDGRKRFEFRRVLFRRPNVRRAVMYASSPVKRVVGEFLIQDTLSMNPSELWQVTADSSGINREYFDNYFRGRMTAHALQVQGATRFVEPRDLERDYGITRPPQSFCYLD